MRAISALILSAATLLAVSVAAQQSPRDFTLPPPRAEPAQGPVDDSGLVPVAPRAIPVQTPAQEPASNAATETAPVTTVTPIGDDARVNRDANRPVAAQAAPATSPAAPRPGPAIESPLSESLVPPNADENSDAVQANALPPPLPSTEEATPDPAGLWAATPAWQWALAGLVALLIVLVPTGFALRRRRIAQRVPIIEPPLAHAGAVADDGADLDQAVELAVEITGLSRSLMMLTLDCHLLIANRSPRALRDLSVFADITSAHRSLPADQQLALESTVLPLCDTLERIGPHQTHTVKFSLQLPVRELAAFRQGEAIACVPLLRIRLEGPSIGCRLQTHVIGLANGSAAGRLRPVPLHTPPGSYPDVRARALG